MIDAPKLEGQVQEEGIIMSIRIRRRMKVKEEVGENKFNRAKAVAISWSWAMRTNNSNLIHPITQYILDEILH